MPELPTGTVTFLMTDIQDSTPLWEAHPAVMSQSLTRHDELIEAIAHKHQGSLIRPRGEGDSRFMVFRRAVDSLKAAAEIQKSFYAEPWPEGIPLVVRIGIHTGEGEYRSGDYYGTAVNRCARLRGLAHGGQTLISQSTYELVIDTLPVELGFMDLGERALKGLRRPERVYRLMVPGLPDEQKSQFADVGVLPPALSAIPRSTPAFLDESLAEKREAPPSPVFVARQAELKWLDEALQGALAGNGKVVFVAGGPGRGKTGLVDAFSKQALRENPEIWYASCNCHAYAGVGDAYGPFREIMGMLSGDVESQWGAGAITTQTARSYWDSLPVVVEAILNHGPHLPGIFVDPKGLMSRAVSSHNMDPALLVALHEAITRQTQAPADLDQGYLFEQYTNVLLNLAKHRPLLLFLDDMQWTDASSASLLFHLGRRLVGHKILVICSFRPEEVAMGRASVQYDAGVMARHPLEKVIAEFKRLFGDVVLDLGRIDEMEGRNFVDAYLDSTPNRLDEGFRKALFRHTAGHPLFTIELIRAMKARGDLVQGDGRWVQGPSLDWKTLPARIEGVIEERISRLDKDLREILAAASVEGVVFTSQVLARAQEISELQLLRQLKNELENRHRLVAEQDEIQVGDHWLSRYRFAHYLIQQHLYTQTSEGERRLLHRLIGEILEDIYAGRETEIALQQVHHFAGDREKERYYAILAGEQAARQFANAEALEFFTRALALTGEKDELGRYKLLISREAINNLTGDRQAQLKDLLELKSLLSRLEGTQADPGQAEVAVRWANYTSLTGYQGTVPLAENAASLAEAEGRPEIAVEAYLIWSNALKIQGEYSPAVQQAETGVSIAHDIGDRRGESSLINTLGLIALEQEEPGEAQEFFERSLAIAREIADLQLQAHATSNLGICAAHVGDYGEAQSCYESALRLAREIGNRRGEGLVLVNLGWVASLQGDYTAAESSYHQAGLIAREVEDRYQEAYVAINLCASILAQGDYHRALAHARQGLELAREVGDRSGEAWAVTFLGHICYELGELEKALAEYQQALEIRRSLNQPNLAAEPLAGLARIALVREDLQAARERVEEILGYLEAGGSLEGAEEPLRVLMTCYRVLQAVQDSRAGDILEDAYQMLGERADRIPDENLRRKFLENIPHHQEISTAWRAHQG
jgi:predicted ATPase/class 3 adenylate cyclase